MKSARWTILVAMAQLIIGGTLYAQALTGAFQKSLQQNKMQFTLPPGFVATPVIANDDVIYDYAIKSKSEKLEIRFRIWPIEIRANHPADPNSIYEAMMMTMGLNISGGEMMQASRYPAGDVKKEFGADGGATGSTPTHSNFGKGYKFCMISAIHLDNVADAYVFYLYDDMRVVLQAIRTDKRYHALKFR